MRMIFDTELSRRIHKKLPSVDAPGKGDMGQVGDKRFLITS